MARWLFTLVMVVAVAVAQPARAQDYEVSARVWIDGELRGTPTLIVEPDREGSIEMASGDTGWRLSVLIEPPADEEQADPGGVWMVVGLEQKIDGGWEHLTETLIGTPLGEPGRISVVAPDAPADASPEQAQLFVELVARRLEEPRD